MIKRKQRVRESIERNLCRNNRYAARAHALYSEGIRNLECVHYSHILTETTCSRQIVILTDSEQQGKALQSTRNTFFFFVNALNKTTEYFP